MFVAGWSFTNKCNLRCIHCYNASGKAHCDEMSTEQAKKIAQKLIDFGIDAVNFGGGECPLRPDFIEICGMLHKAGIKISLTTNGTTLKLVKNHLHLFHDVGVSIDFADEKNHDAFRGVPGTYKKAVKATRFFVKKGMDTEIVTCITSMNCSKKEMQKMYDLAKSIGVDYWRLNRYRPTGRNNTDKLTLTPDDLRKSYSFLNKHVKNMTVPDPLFAIFSTPAAKCPCGSTSFRIQANGDVTPCVFLKVSGGNILENSIQEILDSPVFRQIRNRDLSKTKCSGCKHWQTCRGGCAGNAYLVHGTFNKPDPLCWKNDEWNVHEKYLCTAYVPIRRRSNARKTAQA
ncbi:MAG: radical SAM protein [Candidatus Aenigmatarchaeota archaeon]